MLSTASNFGKFKIFRRLIRLVKRQLLPRSLLSRFVLIIVIPTLIGQYFAVRLFYERHWYNVSLRTSSLIVTEIESLLMQKALYKTATKKIQDYLNLSYIFFAKTKIVKNSGYKPEEISILQKKIEEKIKYHNEVFIDQNGKIQIAFQVNKDLLVIVLPSKILLNPTTDIFTAWLISLTLILLATSLIFSKNQIKSILDLTSAAEKYGRGESMDNYKPSGAQEIRKAGLAFIKMKERIERQTARRTQMLAMISHDLKTPLTRMKLQVELMDDSSEEKEELSHDIITMQQMISSYLDFARGEGAEDFISVNITDWLRNYLRHYSNNNIEFKVFSEEITLRIKPHSFTRAMDNLIGNSLKYANKVRVSLKNKANNVLIIIEDDGKGIDESEKDLVFRPFYRGNKARTLEDSTSVGLGLAITKEIISGHYGSIKLDQSKELGGLLVRIELPAIY